MARLLPSLGEIGFAALSVFGKAKPAPIAVVNTHVDIIDWHGGRGGKDHGVLALELARELKWRREAGSREAIGVLTHHLVHDEIAWLFMERLLEVTAANPAVPMGVLPRPDLNADAMLGADQIGTIIPSRAAKAFLNRLFACFSIMPSWLSVRPLS